ncbi:hypothetical protein HDV06_000712 [Boothiomyces sp. JEL0866]|nr:hypothetical protein HDV06_000712 [Boothiomyces sp. JEL0866]
MTDAQIRRERYRNFVIPTIDQRKGQPVGPFAKRSLTTNRTSKFKIYSLFVYAAMSLSKKYRNSVKGKIKKTEFDYAIDDMAELIANTKEYSQIQSDLKDFSQETDFLIKDGGLGGLFAKKPSKSKTQAFSSFLDSLSKLVTQIKYESFPQSVKLVLVNIVKNDKIPSGYYWDNESVLQALKNEEGWSIIFLYFFFVKTLIFKLLLTGFREKTTTEEHNLRAIAYILYKCIRDIGSEGVLDFEQQFKRGIQFWLGNSEIANQWDDSACKLLYKTFESNMDEITDLMAEWSSKLIEKVALKETPKDAKKEDKPEEGESNEPKEGLPTKLKE